MFEFSIALKYLLPKKRALSTSLISLMSIFVISLVVWLILVFLSVTTSIEKSWLKKLTALNAPLRIIPTENYYNSYYYQIDRITETSDYSTKTIKEKSLSLKADEYNPLQDIEIPNYWPKPDTNPDGSVKDLVKTLFQLLDTQSPLLTYQDFEVSGTLMRLSLYRPLEKESFFHSKDEKLSFISQVSYLLSHTDKNPNFSNLVLNPTTDDLNNILSKLDLSSDEILEENPSSPIRGKISAEESVHAIKRFFANIDLKQVKTESNFSFPIYFLSHKERYKALKIKNKNSYQLVVEENVILETPHEKGFIFFEDGNYFFQSNEGHATEIKANTYLTLTSSVILNATLDQNSLISAKDLASISLNLTGTIQGSSLNIVSSFDEIKIYKAIAKKSFDHPPFFEPFWLYNIKSNDHTFKTILPKHNYASVILPKSLKDNGVLIGDRGYFSFATKTAISPTQEQRLPIYVAGFYDPGIFAIGNRCIIVPQETTKAISRLNSAFIPEGIPSNGIFLWTKDLSEVDKIKTNLIEDLKANNLSSYWTVQTYKDYEFAKDLMQQFHSDRMLFIIVAIIIIIVACSNIISLLVLLVNDKKREIAVLQAMGASKKSISLIFAICGISMGLLSSILGSLAAVVTLKHIDQLITILSFFLGHTAFNPAFFGDKLPNMLSLDSLIFILIITPIISLIAGLIPAIKASKMNSSEILKGN